MAQSSWSTLMPHLDRKWFEVCCTTAMALHAKVTMQIERVNVRPLWACRAAREALCNALVGLTAGRNLKHLEQSRLQWLLMVLQMQALVIARERGLRASLCSNSGNNRCGKHYNASDKARKKVRDARKPLHTCIPNFLGSKTSSCHMKGRAESVAQESMRLHHPKLSRCPCTAHNIPHLPIPWRSGPHSGMRSSSQSPHARKSCHP